MKGEDELDDIGAWLENMPPLLPPDVDLALKPANDSIVPTDERITACIQKVDDDFRQKEEELKCREIARAYSEQWGWIYDLLEALYWYAASWWTPDAMLALFRAGYGVLMVALLFGIIYSVFYATANGPNVRTLPTIEEIMETPRDSEAPNPTEGQQ